MAYGPPRDASYTSSQSRTGVVEKLTALDISAGRVNTVELFVNGVPIQDYLHTLIESTAPREVAPLVQRDLPIPPSPLLVSPPQTVEFAQVASRAAYANVADVANGYHDPVNGKKGYLLTSDDYGQGSWQPAPSSRGDVEGPLQSRLHSLAVFDSTEGRLLRDSSVFILDDDQTLSVPRLKVGQNNAAPGNLAFLDPEGYLIWKACPELDDWKKHYQSLSRTYQPQVIQHIGHSGNGEMCWNKALTYFSGVGDAQGRIPRFTASDGSALGPSTITESNSGQVCIPELQVQRLRFLQEDLQEGAILTHTGGGQLEWKVPPAPVKFPPPTQDPVFRKVTAQSLLADQVTVQHLSLLEFHFPVHAEKGWVMTCDDEGQASWRALPPPVDLPPPPPSLETQLAQVNLVIPQPGQLQLDSLQLRHPDKAISTVRGDVLLSISPASGTGNIHLGWPGGLEDSAGHFNTSVGHQSLKQVQSNANVAIGAGALSGLQDGGHNTVVGTGAGDELIHGRNNVALGDGAGPMADVSNSIAIGTNAKAPCSGSLALASPEAPLRLSNNASNGGLPLLNPCAYLPITLNGVAYKLALFQA